MSNTLAYATQSATTPITPFDFDRRDVGPSDVKIEILFCGVCHSDIHQARNEWGNSIFPMVPGHEIVGRVTQVGAEVTQFAVGDLAGVGCMVDSCRECENCKAGEEQYCEGGKLVLTYNSKFPDGTISQGGYSDNIVVDEAFTLKVSPKLDLAAVAPLLCAGITTYSPLKHWDVKAGQKVGVVGLGGLGHMALKFAHAFGAHVTQFTTSPGKEEDAKRLGADEVVLTRDPEALKALANSFDFIIDTVSAKHDLSMYLNLLKLDGSMVLVGVPTEPAGVHAFDLALRRRRLAGSAIGGIKETQEMLDFCAEHNIVSDIEMIDIQDINAAYDRVLKSDVKYRFVIDMASLKA
ncbi:MAG: NAD(P)-dependent alcohol dehydrogenase [Capsulimonas sp.]|uniref:NAD(P)-dependent alcohol dehydrogenase n=1 Tax=Capsulimonas sp. TaxID=2494211 RepID=UPI00326514C0